MYEPLNELTLSLNLTQLINFPTWSRVVNGVTKESILDHIYIKDTTLIKNLSARSPEVGDHKFLTCEINSNTVTPKPILKRNWRNYNKDLLVSGLRDCRFDLGIADVQQFWNQMENQIINVVDKVAPYTAHINNTISVTHPSLRLKPKILQKRRLLKKYKVTKDQNLLTRIKTLNSEIILEQKNHKKDTKRRNYRKLLVIMENCKLS